MIYVLVEPSYANSIWCQKLVEGLIGELKSKRCEYRKISSLEMLKKDAEYVYVIGTTIRWVQVVLEEICRVGAHPILLCNHVFQKFPQNYSVVSSDTNGSMQHLVGLLHRMEKKRIALYGVNPRSASDDCRRTSFLLACSQPQDCVFINDSSLEQCFRDFRPHLEEYDAVLCANDFAAISLVRNLLQAQPQALERLSIIGCAETRLTHYYSKYLVSVRVNFAEFGRAAVTIMDTLRRNPNISNILIHIRWDLCMLHPGAGEDAVSEEPPRSPVLPEQKDIFYEDGELREMLRVEQLLNECDQLDYLIMRHPTRGDGYETIAESCFINISTVKYRIRKMAAISQTEGRRELVKLLEKYIIEPL